MRILEALAFLFIALHGLPSTAHAFETPPDPSSNTASKPTLQEWKAEKKRAERLIRRAHRWNRTELETDGRAAQTLLTGKRDGQRYVEAKEALDTIETTLDTYTALLLEVEPVTIVEVPLERTKLDTALRGACSNFSKIPVADLACALSGEDCKTQAGRAAATLRLPSEPPSFEIAVKTVRGWEDPTKPLDAQLAAGTSAFLGLLSRIDATQTLCRSAAALDFDGKTLDEFLAFAKPKELAQVASVSKGLTGPNKAKALAKHLVLVGAGFKARNALADAEAEPLRPRDRQRTKDIAAARETLETSTEAALVALRDASAMVRGYDGGRGAFIDGGALLGGSSDAIIEGLSEFLLTRAKEEAIHYVRDVFVDRLCTSDVQPFVRSTCETMATVEHTTALRAIGRSLKQAMESDLRRLPDVGVVFASTYEGDLAYFGTTVRLAMAIVRGSRGGTNPLASAWSLHVAPKIDCESTTLELLDSETMKQTPVTGVPQCRKAMALMRSASALLYSIEQQDNKSIDGYWVLAIMNGWTLRWEEMRRLGVAPDHFAPPVLDADILTRVRDPLVRVGRAVKAIRDVIDTIRQESTQDIGTTADLVSAAAATVGATKDAAVAVQCALDPSRCPGADEVTTPSVPSTVGLTTLGYHPTTSSTAFFVPPPPDPLQSGIGTASNPDTIALVMAVTAKDWAAAAPAALKFLDPHVEGRVDAESWDTLKEFVPVIVEIGQATSSADVATTLEAAVPSGGYRSKYRAPTLALNGFVGGAFTYEGYRAGPNDQWVNGSSVALFAPVGLHIAGPVQAGDAKPWAMGGLLSVLDLGTITARTIAAESVEPVSEGGADDPATTTTTEVDEVATLDIRQLFSPGLYFTLGIAESPATIGLGLSYNPFLRDAESTTSDGATSETDTRTDRVSALRAGVFVAIDVTMFAFRLSRNPN